MKRILYLLTITICTYATTAQASDNSRCISKQLQAHQQAEQQLLHAFAKGDQQPLYDATVNLVSSETYLSVCGLPGNDPRIHGALVSSGRATPEVFAAAVFHKRLDALTQFRPDILKAMSEVNWNRVEGVAP